VLPVLAQFELGDTAVTIAAYTTFLVLAAIVAIALGVRGAAGLGVPARRAFAGIGLAVVAGLVGARLLDVALEPAWYAADPGRVASLEPRGFALYGGLAAGIAVMLACARSWNVSPWRLADASVPAVAAGIVLVRVGCFLNGCCSGVRTDLPWGVTFPGSGVDAGIQVLASSGLLGTVMATPAAVHPTQLYELAAVVLSAGAALTVARRGVLPGLPALAFATGFMLFRAANQALRVPPPGGTLSDILPLLYLAGGVALAAATALRWRATGGGDAVAGVAGRVSRATVSPIAQEASK
jgi:phosphatidylglycerol---prolipoprotein diacylglyceryl transferase